MPDSTPAAVDLNHVFFSYGGVEVLHGISFRLNKGEVVGLLGPNGAGKSTTIKILAGIQAQASGAVTVAGLSLPGHAVDVKQRIGYVPETAALFESLTGQEFLELMGRLHDVEEEALQTRIRGVLETFNLTSEGSSRLDSYSKGMRQKILLLASLLHDPELLVLDEPFSGLDVNAAMILRSLLHALAARQKMILYSSHVLEVVEKVAHNVLILRKGRVVAHDSVARLREVMSESSLEGVFAQLTNAGDTEVVAHRILEVVAA